MDISRSTVERALAALRGASGPMAFRELLDAILRGGPLPVRDPTRGLRSAIGNTRLIVSMGDGRYEYLPRATTGCLLRHRLDLDEADENVIVWGQDVAVAIWPAAWEIALRRDRGPRTFRLGNGGHVAQSFEFLGPHRWGSTGAAPIWAWLREAGARSGDDLVAHVTDAGQGEVELAFAPRKQRDDDAIRRRSAEVADLLEVILARKRSKYTFFTDATAELIVRGAFRSQCPPDPLAQIIASDRRFEGDGLIVALSGCLRTWVV